MIGRSVSILEPQRTPCLLTSLGSAVKQAELDELHHCIHIPLSILMKALEMGELPLQPHKESSEIAFPTVALECGVRLPLAPFVKRLLNEFPLHPFQVASAL